MRVVQPLPAGHQDEVLTAAAAHAAAPEPRLEASSLPKPEISEPPLSKFASAPVAPEPGPASQPPAASAPEPAFLGSAPSTPPVVVPHPAPARSMAVRSAALPQEEIHAEPGGAFAQLGAWVVDAIVLGLLFLGYLFLAQLLAGKLPASEETGLDWLIERSVAWRGVLLPGAALLAALSFVYTSLFHTLGGRTLGKRLFGLTVVDATGLPPGLARSAARSLLAFLSAGLLMMGFVLVLFDARKQALHDKLTRTFVVRLAE